MSKKEELKPVDLGHLETRTLFIVDAFRKANEVDRSKEYRAFYLQKAEELAIVQLRDFGYYFDTFKIGGTIPYGLHERCSKCGSIHVEVGITSC